MLGDDRNPMKDWVGAWERLSPQLATLHRTGRSKRAMGPLLQAIFERAVALEQAHDEHVEQWMAEVKRRVEDTRMEVASLLEESTRETQESIRERHLSQERERCLSAMWWKLMDYAPAQCSCGAHWNLP